MEENTYSFGIGGVEKVLLGEVGREDSLSALEIPKDGRIIRPSLIGVYHHFRDTDIPEEVLEAKEAFMNSIIVLNGLSPDIICSELICVGYDPTILPKDLIQKIMGEKDVLRRIKVIEYPELDSIDFSEKGYSLKGVTRRLVKAMHDSSKQNIAVAEREMEILKMMRGDYGLRRSEAVDLAAASRIVRSSVKSDILCLNTSMVLTKIPPDFLI